MPAPAFERAPETLSLVTRVNNYLASRGLSHEGFRDELNQILTPARRLIGHSGLVQVDRWLNPTSARWAEPRGEIVLAMLRWVESQ